MSFETAEVQQALVGFIREELLGSRAPAELGADDDLLGGGLIDSLGVMRLIGFIEQHLEMKVPPADVTIDNFMTVGRISSYLEQRRDRNGSATDH